MSASLARPVILTTCVSFVAFGLWAVRGWDLIR